MAMNYKEVPVDLPEEELQRYATGIVRMNKLADSLYMQGLLPERFTEAEALPLHLRPMPFEIEIDIPEVSEQIYTETRKAVEATGAFITSIRSLSMQALLREDEERGQRGEERRLGYVIDHAQAMWAALPPEMEVFINPKAVRIEDSNRLASERQETKIAEAEARFKDQLPEDVRPFVQFIVADPSTMSQIEDAWMDAGNGLLFPDYHALTKVQDVGGIEGGVAFVGRNEPREERVVGYWRMAVGGHDFFAVPVGVLPRKLVA